MQLHAQISVIKAELEGMRAELQEGLEARSKVREKKGAGRRMIELDEAVERVERLLRVGEAGKASKGGKEIDR